jgi:hypothetical protein
MQRRTDVAFLEDEEHGLEVQRPVIRCTPREMKAACPLLAVGAG